eukprot:1155288-Pelagomonas_calceolata.AAC.1
MGLPSQRPTPTITPITPGTHGESSLRSQSQCSSLRELPLLAPDIQGRSLLTIPYLHDQFEN